MAALQMNDHGAETAWGGGKLLRVYIYPWRSFCFVYVVFKANNPDNALLDRRYFLN